ncbi:hypothetical protein ABFS83_13G037000 [Erythranthe nasuta]
MKLPVDLTSLNLGIRVCLVFMSAAMANFATSLGSMKNNEIAPNLAALAIFVITIAGNVSISIAQMSWFINVCHLVEEVIGSTVSMIFLLLILRCSALMVPTAKREIDSTYREMHRRISNDKKVEWGKFSVDELRIPVRKYWVMAETGNSQFVIARSVTCVASGLVCLLSGLTLLEAHVRLMVQSAGVALATIAPLMRWFIAARFKSSNIGTKSFKDEMKVENYWTQLLVDWKERPATLQIRSHLLRKVFYGAKGLLLNFCIGVQIAIVLASKLVLLFSALCVKGVFLCFHHINTTLKSCCYSKESNNVRGADESMGGTESDYSRYVLLLEGEPKLPRKTLKNICNEVDKLMKSGRKNRPKNLFQLVKKSVNFNGVREFDSDEVPILQYSQEPPNCWSLPSVAISLPDISNHKRYFLQSAVNEGLYFVKLIEKSLDKNGDLTSIRHAADIVWVGVQLSKKWQDMNLQSASRRGGSHKETLRNLSDTAEKIVTDFTTESKDLLVMQNPLNWPVKVIAARSMYRITQTILLAQKRINSQTNEELFERLSVTLSDIFAACLTNLVSVITLKCHSNAIEERDESVRQAAFLLGESEEILEIIQKRELPSLNPKKAASIEEWRAFMELNPSASVLDSSK